jgi:molybdate-binding protein
MDAAMMPDEIQPIVDLEGAVKALNREHGLRALLEERVKMLEAENLALKGMLCQCKTDSDFEIDL